MGNTAKAVVVVAAAALVGAVGYLLMGSGPEQASPPPEQAVVGSTTSETSGRPAMAQEAADREVIVYKTAACGCCGDWAQYLREQGFSVTTEDVSDLAAIKVELGVPPQLQSCHTAVIGGYVVEGHVPVEPIRRMLQERPAIAGLAVPGMPIGSPGMEMPDRPADSYDIVAFDGEGGTSIYDSR